MTKTIRTIEGDDEFHDRGLADLEALEEGPTSTMQYAHPPVEERRDTLDEMG